MIVAVANIAVAGALLFVGGGTGRNMLQTYNVARHHHHHPQPLEEGQRTTTTTLPAELSGDADGTVQYLQSLKRKQLVELFCSGTSPTSLSEIEGEWDGHLLDNNGLFMTKASDILTNILFSMGRKWNGKAFRQGGVIGENRFIPKRTREKPMTGSEVDSTAETTAEKEQENESSCLATTQYEHKFDTSIETSGIDGTKNALIVKYSKYQFPLSLWSTMIDELRFIDDGQTQVLIGMGSMGWSGGRLNSSPFCLFRVTT